MLERIPLNRKCLFKQDFLMVIAICKVYINPLTNLADYPHFYNPYIKL